MNARIKVCNVDEEGRFGGPERRIVQVSKALPDHGVDTHVLYPSMDSEEFARHLRGAEIACTALDITRLTKQKSMLLRYALRFPLEVWRMAAFFKRSGFELVHVNGSYQFKVALAGKLAGLPVVWHLNDTMMDGAVKRAFAIVAKYCSTAFIVAGQRVYDYYLRNTKLEGLPWLEVHAPVDTGVFMPADDDDARGDGLTVATVSGINPTKGVEFFVEMAARLRGSATSLSFEVAGAELDSHSAYSAEIQKLVRERSLIDDIRFFGLVNDVPAFLRRADICVFSSISEASPTSIWEAMAMGKPLVTTDVGSVNQYVEDGVSGYIVPVRDVDGLSDRVGRLLNDPSLRKRMGAAAREVAVAKLGVDAAAMKHAEIYRRALAAVGTNDQLAE